jgi:DNA-binding FadR family transcriptional regulator
MEHSLERLVRPPSLHHSVQDAIRKFILDNGLRAGDALPGENDLARRLGVSRNSVREAIRGMESLGILEIRRGSGIFVRAFSFEPLLDSLSYGLLVDLRELSELLTVRGVLETGMIADAIAVMPDDAIAEMQALVETMRACAAQGEPMVEEDRRFHQLLFESLGNETLLKLLDVFWLTFRKASQHSDITDDDPVRTALDHAAIAGAVKDRDIKRAKQALGDHYTGLLGRLQRAQSTRKEQIS